MDSTIARAHRHAAGARHDGKENRAVATTYDKLAVRYEATVLIAAINQWLRHG